MFDDLAIALHETAVAKGFWPEDIDDIFIAKQLVYKLKFNYVFMQFGKA